MSTAHPRPTGRSLTIGGLLGRCRPAIVLLALAAPMAARAQNAGAANGLLYKALGSPDDWTITGSVRARAEGIDNQFRPALNHDDAALLLQSTLFAEYHPGALRIGGEVIDARSYFQRRRTSVSTTEVNALELSQAYLAYDLGSILGGKSAVLTAGRQTINEGSRRLIARQAFRNSTNAFTGIRFDWQDKQADKLRLFWLMPHTRLPNDADGIRDNDVEWDHEGTDLQLWGGSFTMSHAFGGTFQVYGYKLDEHDTPRFLTRNRRIVTSGARLYRAPKAKAWDWDIEAAYQFGHARGTTAASDLRDQSVSAYFAHVEAGHSFASRWSPRVAAKFDIASGDGPNRDSYTRFDTLFGARRFDFGPTSLFGAVQRANLIAPGLQLEVQPSKRLDAFIGWRALWLQNRTDSFAATGVRDATGRSGRFAGDQVEGRVRYWLKPKLVRLDTGAAVLAKGHFLRDAPNAPATGSTLYGYASIEFTL